MGVDFELASKTLVWQGQKEGILSVHNMLILRGARFAERFGNTTSLFNIEVRFPFINYLALGFPLKMIFGNIRGHAFVDIGAAWDR